MIKFKLDALAVQKIGASARWVHCDLFEISVSDDGVVSFGPCVTKGDPAGVIIYDPAKKKQQLESCILKATEDLSIISGE